MLFLIFIFAASFVVSVPLSSELRSSYTVKETHNVPEKWLRVGPASGDEFIKLQIALRQSNPGELERRLYEVSDPGHRRYGQHLSGAEITKLIRPTEKTITMVEEWLLDHDIQNFQYSQSKDWVNTGPLSISVVEQLLNTKYYVFQHVKDGTRAIRAPEWSLPSYLYHHVDVVQPTSSFFNVKTRQGKEASSTTPTYQMKRIVTTHSEENFTPTYEEMVEADWEELGHVTVPDIKDLLNNPTVAEACNHMAISPLCIRVLYGTFDYVPQLPGNNHIGVVNYLEEAVNRSDLQFYLERYRQDAAKANAAYSFEAVVIDHEDAQATTFSANQLTVGKGVEAGLDAQTVLGIGFPIPLVTFDVGGRGAFEASEAHKTNVNEPYLTWLQHVLSLPDAELPQVITTSYADEEQTVPYAYAQRVCQGFAQLGARGVSVIFPSGDEGVGPNEGCISNDGTNRKTFLPNFPASCPFVTTVGATRNLNPEIVGFDARSNFVSGGGFSNYFPQPSYQSTAVNAYLTQYAGRNQFKSLLNGCGRGYPDVSTIGYHYLVIHQGSALLIDGTSASAPTFASIISLVNDALMADGRPPLGFLNPWIYSKGFRAFTDITYGSARGCNTTGFLASEGWDPVTGYGTPVSASHIEKKKIPVSRTDILLTLQSLQWFPKLKELAMEYKYRASKPWYYGPIL